MDIRPKKPSAGTASRTDTAQINTETTQRLSDELNSTRTPTKRQCSVYTQDSTEKGGDQHSTKRPIKLLLTTQLTAKYENIAGHRQLSALTTRVSVHRHTAPLSRTS